MADAVSRHRSSPMRSRYAHLAGTSATRSRFSSPLEMKRLPLVTAFPSAISNDPPAEPGAFVREPLKAAGWGRWRGPVV